MDVKRTPIQPAKPESPDEPEPYEALESYDSGGRSKGGGSLFGDPDIPPSVYHCPVHGDLLAQDVLWKQDGRPCCPMCGAALDLEG